jgi:tetratricopeptide (TPR) repeat protein
MRHTPFRRRLLGAALLVLAISTPFIPATIPVAMADQRDPGLGPLFQYLKKATRPEEANLVEDKIWEIWSMTGDPALDRLMIASSDAMEKGDYPTALAALDALTAARPDFAEGWNKRATVYYLMGEYSKAIADIHRTLALEPRHFGALSGLGLTSLKLGDDAAAADAFQRVLAIDPLYPNARQNLERAEAALKRNSI